MTVTIYLAIAIGFLQFALYSLNLPYWNLSLNRNFSAIDSYLGFRPSGLLGEPKYLSVFIAMALFINFKASGFKKAHNVLLSLALIFLFYKTGSGNGILAFILGSIITYSFFTSRQFVIIKALCIFSVILFLAIYFKDYIFVRESHQKILTNIFDLSYQDDLVKLPIYAWLANLQYVVLGWGYGLIHYFSLEFLPLADWFELRYGYIDSNIGLISFISNFGVTGLMIFCYAFVKAKKVNRSFDMFVLLLTSYITIFVGASHTYPSYLIMGYIFSVSRSLADLGSNDKGI
ncbi:hypothetical protein [Vibrio breoganii]|uniref:hypothetical protein n=1 Tax=Vibrio breoganii TaxID=553239 RepID=UPI001055EDB9|nr:hypothetical protein [Vibrio breoganii]